MAKIRSHVLVIDASVARAAGDISAHPISESCRVCLLTILDLCHQMAMSDSIKQEWNKHQSRFARQWRTSMMARKKIEPIGIALDSTLKGRIDRKVVDKYLASVIQKDRHLIEAALATEKRVVSLDDAVRKHLRNHCARVPEVRSICWVNPSIPEEKAITWLESGAPLERFRMLGHHASRSRG